MTPEVSEDKPGRINQYKRGSDLMTTLSYDNKNFPSGITTSRAGTTFQQLGMVFNPNTGNMSSRSDVLRGLTESFNYDNLDRLEQSQVAGLTALEMEYEDNGNISYKSDAGEYDYDPLRSHAVTSVSSSQGPTPFPLEQQDITYTLFHSVKTITEGNNSLSIQYGPDRQRRRMVLDRDGLTTTTLYGRNYERVTSGSEVKHYHYIGSPTGLAAILINGQVYFPLSDHLGSITGLVSSANYTLAEEYSYDAWGRRRNPADWSYENVPVPAYLTRGYTGHEHLDDFGLINMNGRVYDPLLGRFLSPDNYVQMPYGTQGFNRFGYCLNNPLLYTDPSGELIWVIPNIGWSKSGGLSIGISVVVGVPGVWSAQAGVGYNFKSEDAYGYVGATVAMNTISASYSTSGGYSVGYSAGATVFSGLPISSNIASVGLNYNITNNSLSGNISAWQIDQNGVTFNPSFSMMVFPEQTTNLVRAGKFMNNDKLLNYYVSRGEQQKALNKFGFKGTYCPDYYEFAENCNPAKTNEFTGDIFYNETAFDGGFDKLYASWDHEMSHKADILAGKINYRNGDKFYNSAYRSEVSAYLRNIKHEGFYRKHGFTNWVGEVNYFGMKAGLELYLNSYWRPTRFQLIIYRTPRLW